MHFDKKKIFLIPIRKCQYHVHPSVYRNNVHNRQTMERA